MNFLSYSGLQRFWAKVKNYVIQVINDITPESINAVPVTRTVNGKALNQNISLNYSDVGAAYSGHSHSLSSLGAASSSNLSSLQSTVSSIQTTVNALQTKVDSSGGNIYTTTYVGTGVNTYKRTLTFPSKPIIVFVQAPSNHILIATQGIVNVVSTNSGSGGAACPCSWSGNSFTWEGATVWNASEICNAKDTTYHVTAFLE